MKILFLYMTPPRKFIPRGFSSGLGSISAVLKAGGHTTELLYVESLNKKVLRKSLSGAGIIAVSASTDQRNLTKKVVGFLSAISDIPIILGGVHATVVPKDAIEIKGLYGICLGEGEAAMLELVNALELNKSTHSIKNFWFRSDNNIIKNSVRPLIEDLDALPFPDRSIFNYQEVINNNYNDGAEFIAGRGCPFQCSFCINKTLQNIYKNKGKFTRYRGVDNVIKEIRTVLSEYNNIRKITFHDDIFGLNTEWLSEFAEKYANKINMPFRCNMRADLISEKHASLLQKAGCAEVLVGVECGNEKLRNKILKKRLSSKQIINAFALLNKYGLNGAAFNMIGLPGETAEDIEETIKLNKRLVSGVRGATIFRPYPGTELYNLCKSKNWLSKRKISGFFEESILDQPTLSREDTYFYQILFYYENLMPSIAAFIRWLNKIKIYPGLSLFRLLHNKFTMYRLFVIIKKIQHRSIIKR